MATAAVKPSPLAHAAPTRVAVFRISGQITYALLCLSVQQLFEDLPAASLMPLQQKFRNIHYLVIDEKSMVGQIQIGWIDEQLCQIFPEQCEKSFSGLEVLLISDFFQLLLVSQASLFSECSTCACELAQVGCLAYESIDCTAILTQVMRQDSDNEQSIVF
jgi:hypothetical protein